MGFHRFIIVCSYDKFCIFTYRGTYYVTADIPVYVILQYTSERGSGSCYGTLSHNL